MLKILSGSNAETYFLGKMLGGSLPPNSVVCFSGDLGVGKTTFIRGIAAAMDCEDAVSSPTFTYMNLYPGKVPIYHFDLYRLASEEEFVHMGFDEFFDADGICCVEWSENISSLLPDGALKIRLKHVDASKREIDIFGLERFF